MPLDKKEIMKFIESYQSSSFFLQAQLGENYYRGKHAILDHLLFYYDKDGIPQIDTYRNNARIPHPFFTELVDQAADYLLSGKERLVKSDIPELQDLLDPYFGDEFKYEQRQLLSATLKHGSAYFYRYADADKKSKFKAAGAMNVIECDPSATKDGGEYVIYFYPDKELDGEGKEKDVTRVQVWERGYTCYYVIRGNDIFPDEKEKPNPRPNVLYKEGEKLFYDVFDSLPFFRVDNTPQRQSEIHRVKELIDDYDLMACALTNNLQDFNEAVYMVKGYAGNDVHELQQQIKTTKIIGTDGINPSEGLEVVTVQIPYEARTIKLELDEGNIYKFGMGFNNNQVGDGNITNIVIKSRYALLDLKCNRLEANLKRMLKEVIKIVIDEINEQGYGFSADDVYLEFERNVISNETDNASISKIEAETRQVQVNTLMSLTNLIGEQKVMELIGEALDIDLSDVELQTVQESRTDLNEASNLLM